MAKYEAVPESEFSNSNESLLQSSTWGSRKRSANLQAGYWILVAILATYTIISSPILIWQWQGRVPQPYSPANHVVSFRREKLYFGQDEKYAGLSDDVDEAWDDLLEPLNIRTSYEEQLKAHGDISQDIVQPSDGGYVSVLSVYHELHCLDTLRRNMFRQHYYANTSDAEKANNMVHITHCIDTIRRSLMCKADTAMYTAYWIGNHTAIPSKELRSQSDTICVDWDALDMWARERLLARNRYKVKAGPFEGSQMGE